MNERRDIPSEAIILAGGLGTRLRSELPDLPKCMAPIEGRPFIEFLVDRLHGQGVTHIVFSLGYKADAVESHIKAKYPGRDHTFVTESEPLGTGGAIMASLGAVRGGTAFVLNGDTHFDVDLGRLARCHRSVNADCTVALKPMREFSRYGRVETDPDGRILAFREKEPCREGMINGGVYVLEKSALQGAGLPEKFSFEEGYLAAFLQRHLIIGMPQDGYFIDIGIPEDYRRAQVELRDLRPALDLSSIDGSWTLFLDRDGVINHEKAMDYIRNPSEFRFIDGAPEAIAAFASVFGRILVVTNQKGIGRGLMTESDLADIHRHMLAGIGEAGGRVDRIYHCPDTETESPCRKPNPGMGLRAMGDYPEIRSDRCLMVGNTMGDMGFGRAIGAWTVFLPSTKPMPEMPHPMVDAVYPDLRSLAKALLNAG
jgi:D-glycero-alpha-D-manno-heptose 1-phosphate guanylyltransferase